MDPKLIRRVRRWDRIATGVITGGGIFTIVCVIGILLLIMEVALPLFLPANAGLNETVAPPAGMDPQEVLAVGLGEYNDNAYLIQRDGTVVFLDVNSGSVVSTQTLPRPDGQAGLLRHIDTFGKLEHSLTWSDGAITLMQVQFPVTFDQDANRIIGQRVEVLDESPAPPPGTAALQISMGRFEKDAGATYVRALSDGTLLVSKTVIKRNIFGKATKTEVQGALALGLGAAVTVMTGDLLGHTAYLGTQDGRLLRVDVEDPEQIRVLDTVQATEGAPVTALGMLVGDYTVVVGDEQGGLAGWFPVPESDGNNPTLQRVHPLQAHRAAVTALVPSLRSKTMGSLGVDGSLYFDQLTTERRLLSMAEGAGLRLVGINTRANGLVGVDGDGRVWVWDLHIDYPEASFGAYFAPIQYETYKEPSFVWQSTGFSDSFEAKLSLMPLIFGTLKATFYGMLVAAPIAVLAAMYTSQLMHVRLRRYIKPIFEIMGSVPTVVIGFLAALWLAPILQANLTAFFLFLLLLPCAVILAAVLYEAADTRWQMKRFTNGYEFLTMAPVVVLTVALTALLGWGLDLALFGGDLPHYLFNEWGMRVDQRNSIVIGFALGFAIIPTVYSISDDALTNVPRNLTAASLALGASRWQTLRRVVLPSASPGIFAALMVGLGRAVGETMIVLMATGNTPIMDWSLFNGMRTLSANIAVEIPEAPHGETLYRTLFLSGVLLFMATFLVNTVAEVVRIRLRKKYGQY